MAKVLPGKALTFDDVHMLPQYSTIKSRKIDIDISVRLNNSDLVLRAPVIASPMDTVSGPEMAIAIQREAGGLAIIHRYSSIEKQVEDVRAVVESGFAVGAAVGINGDYLDRAQAVVTAGAKVLCVDVAHGHSALMESALKKLRGVFSKIHIMAGNVATLDGFNDLCDWGADSIRIGIGSGCFAGNTRVLMADASYKNIKDILVGDLVIGGNGAKAKVAAVRNSGLKSVVAVSSKSWPTPTYATPDHSYVLINPVDGIHSDSIGAPSSSRLTMPPSVDFQLSDASTFLSPDGGEYPINYEFGYSIGAWLVNGAFGKDVIRFLPKNLRFSNKAFHGGILDGMCLDVRHINDLAVSRSGTELIEQYAISYYIAHDKWPELSGANAGSSGQRSGDFEKKYTIFDYSIADGGYVETFDIEVESDDHTFVANNAVVHNSICSTRTQTGHGYPMLQNILDVAVTSRSAQIVSDGGIKEFGDINKALGAGAHMVMMGSMFAGTDEAPGQVIDEGGVKRKTYRGMASPQSQLDWRGFYSSNEGISTTVPYKGSVGDVLKGMVNAIQSGLSYTGARNLQEYRDRAAFKEVSHASSVEATTHILKR